MNPHEQLTVLQNIEGLTDFSEKIKETDTFPIKPVKITIFQINTGRRCILSCKHCHVNAGPERDELMSKETMSMCLDAIKNSKNIDTVDITGGSPEMNDNLEWFLEELSQLNKRILVRTNFVILLEEKYRHFIDIYAKNKVEIVGSLPDYSPERTDKLRGEDVFNRSIKAIRMLNEKGYGKPDTGLILDLVHNPAGAYFPASQNILEKEYKMRLYDDFKICFNSLFCLTNIPVGRYLDYLLKSENYIDYFNDLVKQYNPSNISNIMCRSTISIGYDGKIYDCDFNQMLDLTVSDKKFAHIKDFSEEKLNNRDIVLMNHCYGCTAGAGSSCQGCLE